MNVIVKRRQIIIATMVVALGAAVFVNWYYTGNNLKSEENKGNTEYVQNLGEANFVNATNDKKANDFSEMKLKRKKASDEALDNLNKSLKNVKAGTKEAQDITQKINSITYNTKKEIDTENLVKTALKCESFVSINEGNARVIVEKGKLNESSAIKIFEIVGESTKIEPSNITVAEN